MFSRETGDPEVEAEPRWRRILGRATLSGPDYPSRRMAARLTFFILLGMSCLFGVMAGLSLVYSVDLPQMEDLARYRPSTTTELLDIRGNVFGSFALERRVVVPYSEFPATLREAIISIEDKTFENNWGVNLVRAVGAAYRDVHSRSRAQGSSTLTMQLARNLFLSSQKTYGRKLQEVFLTVQIERRFTKAQIFALYANQIYLGHGTYGFEAGAEFYFSKHVRELSLAESALLAALPKGPEYYSPIRNPQRALRRRNLVLSEMLQDGKITPEQASAAKAAPLGLHIETPPNSVAPYFVEEVRRQLEKQYGVEEVHGAGLRVYTTLDLDLQLVANKAVLDGVAAYERRHGWKGRVANVALAGNDPVTYRHPDWTQPVEKGAYVHALVTAVAATKVTVKIGAQEAVLGPEDWRWTQIVRGDNLLRTSDVVYVRVEGNLPDGTLHASLQQDSGTQAAMMAMDNSNGEVVAMVGGRDFALSQFNRATQALRQVGSSFKPYVYTTAIEAGAKPSDLIVDSPTTFWTASGPYTPHNYEPDYKGSMTLLDAFAESRNIPALKLAERVGIHKVIETAHRFGITSNIPAYLPVAIGSADMTLYEQVGAYAVFPNDGIRIEPHYIRRVTQADGIPLEEKAPQVTEVLSVETARTMMQFLKSVVRYGTASAAAALNHPLGGKTGTTNDFTDAWFLGFSPSVTCGTWIGFDDRQSLGKKETGAQAALPMWMDFMKAADARTPKEVFATAGAPKKVLDVPVSDEDGNGDGMQKPEGMEGPETEVPEGDAGAGAERPAEAGGAGAGGAGAGVGAAPADSGGKVTPVPVVPGAGVPKVGPGAGSVVPKVAPGAGPVVPKVVPVVPKVGPASVPAKAAEESPRGVSNPPPDPN